MSEFNKPVNSVITKRQVLKYGIAARKYAYAVVIDAMILETSAYKVVFKDSDSTV
jgi:hypothetical protein